MSAEPFASWAVLELMGHRRMVGEVAEVELAGTKMIRIDVPEAGDQPAYTQIYGGGAVYCLSPVTEQVARAMLARTHSTEPWFAYELPTALPKPADDEDGEGSA